MIEPGVYQPFVQFERVNNFLYVQALNAIYETLKGSNFILKHFSKDLTEQGFTVNPYEIYASNKIISTRHMTVFWGVDGMKISNKSPQKFSVVIEELKKKDQYDIGKNKFSRVKFHYCLFMIFDYITPV